MALVSKNFSDIITFTRASTATYVDSAGLIQSAANDVARFDYDPVTLAAKGLLIEESRTNLVPYSEDLSSWVPTSVTVTANDTTSPDGTVNADSILETAANARHYIGQVGASITGGANLSGSVYLKNKSLAAGRYVVVWIANGAVGTYRIGCTVDLLNGTVSAGSAAGGGTTTVGTPTITAVGNGWYKVVLTGNLDVSETAAMLRVGFSNTSAAVTIPQSYLGDGISAFYAWGFQLEEGAFPTSYIPTTAAAVTRAVDVATINTLSPWYNATEGTLYVEGATGYISGNIYGAAFQVADGTIDNRVTLAIRSTQQGRVIVAGTVEAFQTAGTVTTNTFVKEAYAYKQNDTQLAVGGTSSAVDTSVNIPSGLTTAYIGVSPSGTGPVNGWIKRITYYPRRMSQAELQALTA